MLKPLVSVSTFVFLSSLTVGGCVEPETDLGEVGQDCLVEEPFDDLPNSVPFPNEHGFAATYSTAGSVALDNAFFTAQGTNGRHCGTCHAPEAGWSMTGPLATTLFQQTGVIGKAEEPSKYWSPQLAAQG